MSAIFENVRKALEREFKNGWANRTPIKYENALFNEPKNADWVAFNVLPGLGEQISIGSTGNRRERQAGVIIVQVFTPQNSGKGGGARHCDFAADIFRMRQLVESGIVIELRTPYVTNGPIDNELLQLNLTIPFQADGQF